MIRIKNLKIIIFFYSFELYLNWNYEIDCKHLFLKQFLTHSKYKRGKTFFLLPKLI